MPKLILMVDSDAALRRQTARSLTARGYEFQENPDGRDVLEQVRTQQPQVLILNVELPRGSGYAICSKLRKDEGLKGLKVVLTSAEATQKAFDDHRKLKLGRADEYLLKPYEADELAHKVVALLGDEFEPDPEPEAQIEASEPADERAFDADEPSDEERVSLDEIEEIEVDEELGAGDASLPGEGDVDLLDSAFQRLEDNPPGALNGNRDDPMSLLDEPLAGVSSDPLDEQANEVLQALEMEPEDRPLPASRSKPARRQERSSSESIGETSDAGAKPAQRDRDAARLREELSAREKELLEQRDRQTLAEGEISRKKEEVTRRDAQIRQLQQRIDALIAGQRRGEKDLQAIREEARAAVQRAETAERAQSANEGQQREQGDTVERLSADLLRTRRRLDELQSEVDELKARNDKLEAETTDLRGNRAVLEEEKHKNEERLVKAYQQLQDGERLRGKTKQALTLALQLLEEEVEDDEPENEDRP